MGSKDNQTERNDESSTVRLTSELPTGILRTDLRSPDPSNERPTTVDVPPEHWFFGTGVDLTRVAQLRLAHTHAQIKERYQVLLRPLSDGVLRTSGQNMVTEMGYAWLADISRYVHILT